MDDEERYEMLVNRAKDYRQADLFFGEMDFTGTQSFYVQNSFYYFVLGEIVVDSLIGETE